jgi:hypothetical protein
MWLRPECEILIGVEALMAAHHAPARGEICVLHAGPDLYIVSFTFSAIGTQWRDRENKVVESEIQAGSPGRQRWRASELPAGRGIASFQRHPGISRYSSISG